MKIAILMSGWFFSQNRCFAQGTLACHYGQASRLRGGVVQFFCRWLPDPFDPEADMLPETAQHTPEEENPLFAERIGRFQPDIIEIHSSHVSAHYLACALPDVPVVLWLHGHKPAVKWPKEFSEALNQITHMMTVSDFTRQLVGEILPEHKKKITTFHNALPAEGWLAKDSEKENIIIWCGRMRSFKGIEEFVQAASVIKSQFPDWRFVVMVLERDKDYRIQQETIFKNALGHQGEWLTNASRAQVQTWTKKARIAVVPSNWDDPFPTTLLEQHMAGCAVISSGRGGMKEVSGETGALYLKEVSSDAIVEALRFLLNNPQERTALARRGHEYVMRHHNIQESAAELDRLRHQIIQRFKQEKGMRWRIRNLIKSSVGISK